MLKYILVSLCLITGYVTYARNCRTTEVYPKGYPCYTHADVTGWFKDLVDNGCHAHASEEEFQRFYKCLGDNNPNYVLTGDSVLRYPLQCGEKLVDTSTLPHNATTVDTIRLFCQNVPSETCKIEPTSKIYKLMSCSMHELPRKFELKYADWKIFKCD